MGWKGTVRSINAGMRAAEREAQKRHKQYLKDLEVSEATDAVESWQDYIHDLVSIHTNPADDIDWQRTASEPKPSEPNYLNRNGRKAQTKLASFKPRFWDFLYGGSEKKRIKLELGLAEAVQEDERDYNVAVSNHKEAVADWESDVLLAKQLLSGEATAKKEVIEELQSLTKDSLVGSAISFRIENDFVHAIPTVHTDEIVPSYRRKQLASGRLSETKMPVGEFNELYQDYVCSVALRAAGDLFGLLPDNEIYVTCVALMLNKKTGHQELTPILSVQFVRDTFNRLNLTHIDPSDSLSNFNHEMNFKRTKGFIRIKSLAKIED